MSKNHAKPSICPVCRKPTSKGDLVHGELVRVPIVERIKKELPDWKTSDPVCHTCLRRLRADYMQAVLESERGELSLLDAEVVQSLREQELLARDLNAEFAAKLTFGERMADRVAEFGGSWRFVMLFVGILVLWIALNSVALFVKPFDPYPFILLNLVLSCVAALQAPVIMMSQNRQEAKDRLRAEDDYRVNLKAELEIRHLHSKLDQLLTHQWQRLLEIQQIQIDVLEELSSGKA